MITEVFSININYKIIFFLESQDADHKLNSEITRIIYPQVSTNVNIRK